MAFIQCNFFSEVLGISTSINVILPENTSNQIGMNGRIRGAKHPTLYLLHGLSDDHTIWQRRTSIERYVSDMGLAVVMPSVHRSFYMDMERGYKYWAFISEELPQKCRSFFPLSDKREDNFTAGLSMGGYGALKLALRYPERFAAAASLSGAVSIKSVLKTPDNYFKKELSNIFGDREVVDTEDDLFYLVQKVAASNELKPKLYQCCGTEDFLYEDNQRFREFCSRVDIDLTYDEQSGSHEWGYWDMQIQKVLNWLPL